MMLFCQELKLMPKSDSYEDTLDLVENNEDLNKIPQELIWVDLVFNVPDIIGYSRRITKGFGFGRTTINHRYLGEFTINIKFDDFNIWYKSYINADVITSKDLLHQIGQI